MESSHISRLASEILLFFFLHLDLNQLVVCRRVNKQFQEVIDNNQLLWRIFEWESKHQESFRPALDMVDQKSRSSLEKVSFQEHFSKKEDLLHLMQVLNRSEQTLKEIELRVSDPSEIQKQAMELMTTLRSLVVWDWASNHYRDTFPVSRLLPPNCNSQKSSVSQIRLLWVWNEGVAKVGSKHLNSLISFALGQPTDPGECLNLISSFSETVVHLRLGVSGGDSRIEPLFCPNLKIFEGWVGDGISSCLDAPQLQIIVLESVFQSEMRRFPFSVEEIWLRSRSESLHLADDWEPLLRLCPKLRILKLTEEFFWEILDVGSFVLTGVLEVLEMRKKMAQDGEEMDGIKIVSLEKFILPTSMLNEEELNRAAEVAEEVVDVKDYKEFINIEY